MVNIKIDIPEKVSTNKIYDGTHWSFRYRLKSVYYKAMLQHRNQRVEKAPAHFKYAFRFKSKVLDVSNCSYMVKLLEDSMKAHGIIEDDNTKHVKSIVITSQKGTYDNVTITSS